MDVAHQIIQRPQQGCFAGRKRVGLPRFRRWDRAMVERPAAVGLPNQDAGLLDVLPELLYAPVLAQGVEVGFNGWAKTGSRVFECDSGPQAPENGGDRLGW